MIPRVVSAAAIAATTAAVLALAGCQEIRVPGVYRIDIQQGNVITQEQLAALEKGMEKRKVRFILGTPLVADTFNQDRWDYPYVKRNGPNILSQSLLTVQFDGDSLIEVSGDYLPPAWGGQAPSGEAEPEEES